ncbi:MAG TPA: peptidoglycan DD-metalloendopeptidase family protein [Candidatus Paceibacterota bacterium]
MRAGERYSVMFLVFTVLLTSAIFPYFVFANNESELRVAIEAKNKEIERIEEEIKQYQKSVEQTSAAARTLQGTINRINQEIKNLNYQLSLTKIKISKTALEIQDLEAELQKTLDAIHQQRSLLAEALRQLDELERQTLVEVLLEYSSLTQFFDIIEKNKTIEHAMQQLYDELRLLQTNLETQKGAAENARTTLLGLTEQLTDQRALEDEERKAKSYLLRVTKNQEAQYQKLLKEREQQRDAIEREMEAIEDELRRLIDPSLLPTKGTGVLAWPVVNPIITQGFGLTAFSQSTDVYNGKGHNGIDLRASIGTPMYAAEKGTVKDIGDTDIICPGGSYGKWIVIEHPNNLSTLYAHLSRIRVTSGQTLSRGDIIGLSGNTGYTTGPHLHFTVYASNTFRQAKTKHCGLAPAGGYLNPLDYL